jgi:hypothetical protein
MLLAEDAARKSTDMATGMKEFATSNEKFNGLKIHLDSRIIRACSKGEYIVKEDLRWYDKDLVKRVAKCLRANGYKVRVPWFFPTNPVVSISWSHHKGK